ncbi:MAG: tyrosine-protein phosphatase [Clostridia bacterium]|nr:tyrosine-protein phosphatase [Clostridia bacterium]
MIKLLTPGNGENVILLKERHREYIAEPVNDPDIKVDWLDLKATGTDMSFPDPVLFSFEPAIDGEITVIRKGGETRVIKAKAGRAEITNFYIDADYEWYVKAGWMTSEKFCFHTDAQAPRMLYVDGISNVRDIGGFRTLDGRRVKQGLLYRTSEMDSHVAITEQGKSTLMDELGIRLDVDIRGINNEPRCPVLDESRVRWLNYPLAAYAEIFTDEQKELYRQTFELAARRDSYPLMLHCWGGIDRTGTWLYILGGLLGVSEDDLGLDYEMSSFSRWNRRSRRSAQFTEFLTELHRYGEGLYSACVGFLADCGVSSYTMSRIRDILLEEI